MTLTEDADDTTPKGTLLIKNLDNFVQPPIRVKSRMKVWIMTDLEGVAGVFSFDEHASPNGR